MPNLKQTVVVVDDDTEMNQALERLLNAAGCHALTFPSAEALLEAGAAASAACLVFDVQLPGLSGLELCRQLREGGTETPVIFITAYDDAGSRAEAEEAGALAYFTKPFPRQIFLAAIDRALDRGILEGNK